MNDNSDKNTPQEELKINCPKCDQHLVLETPELFAELSCPACECDLSNQLTRNTQDDSIAEKNLSQDKKKAANENETHVQKDLDLKLLSEEIEASDSSTTQQEVEEVTKSNSSSIKEKLVQELVLSCEFCQQKIILENPDQFEQIICPGCEQDISDQKPTKVLRSSFKITESQDKAKAKDSLSYSPDKKDPIARITESKIEQVQSAKSRKSKREIAPGENKTKSKAIKSKNKSKGLAVSQSTVKKLNTNKKQQKSQLTPILIVCVLILGGLIYKSKDLRELFDHRNKVATPAKITIKRIPLEQKPVSPEPKIQVEEAPIVIEVEEELKPLELIDEMKVPESALLNKNEIKTLISKLNTHCYSCHGNEVHEEDLNFEALKGAEDYYKKYNIFKQSLAFIRASEMPPPEDGEIDDQEKEEFAELVQKLLFTIETRSRKVSKKPKIQRLNSKNFNTTVKAVTGLKFDFSKKFQIDNTNDISIVSFEKFLAAAEFISRYAAYDLQRGFYFSDKAVLKQPKNILIRKLKTQQFKYLPGYYFKDFKHEEALRRSMLALAEFLREGKKDKQKLKKIAAKYKISPIFVEQTSAFINKYSRDTTISKGFKEWKLLKIKKYPEDLVAPAVESFISHWKSSLEELESNEKISNLKRKQIQKFDQVISAIFVLPDDLIQKELEEENIIQYTQVEELITFIEHKKLSPNLTALMKTQSKQFLDKLLRRPAESAEVNSFLNSFLQLTHQHGSDNAVQLMMTQSFLRTEFLFRFEKKTPAFKKLSAFELANRLSYLIWNQPPDQKLYELASSGEIFNREVLISQVQDMIKDKRSQAMLKAFLNKWLEIDVLLDKAQEDPIYEDMYKEIVTYFDYVIKNDLNLQYLLNSDFTFLNDRMAEFYNIDAEVGYVFRKRPLNTDQRGGITGMAGFMALTSPADHTNPILRGNFILSSILGTPTPPPPPDAGILPDKTETKGLSLRQVLGEHRKNPNCKGCHMLIDPLGFPLENYDHMGRWRDNVDNQAQLTNGKSITGPKELRRYLIKNRDHFYRKISAAFLSYAMNRELNHYDFYLVNKSHTNLRNNDNRFSAIVATIILSDQFQYKL